MPTVYDRRSFLGALGTPVVAAAVVATLDPMRAARSLEALSSHTGAASDVARDESFWFEVQQAYTCDRSLINFNNGGVSPAPAVVQEAMKRHLDYSNLAPAHTMWHVLEPQREPVRERLGRFFGCDPEEIALTRNASEGLQICQFGFDLEPGDEVLTTNQDYPRMINTFKQRERREGIKLVQFSIPVPAEDPEEIVRRFESHITSRTRVILMCHMINLTGQILPVKSVVEMARRRGIPVLVDGAHSFAHFEFTQKDLDCDFYATSLHKWLCAPHGTGLLYVRRDQIGKLWPLMAAAEKQDDDIRKFEEIGTHPAANYLAIAEALTFHQGIGSAHKSARLRYLRDLWAKRLIEHDRVRLHTSLKPEFSCALATVQVEGVDSVELARHLWREHRILVTAIKHDEFEGIRVTPHVYSTVHEVDRFADVMEKVIRDGLPQTGEM
ncbi:MAG: aminotransferase class V-fold PLP-dependent enzyme [Candidatus Latescibacterota bacterium]|nr:MAG: aminotransferase class V-fold PLP-dependent enzyme [Candidatus Latescibacterota bacterium]